MSPSAFEVMGGERAFAGLVASDGIGRGFLTRNASEVRHIHNHSSGGPVNRR
jgi:hypothetical protein